jgi:hypothetical protein
MISQLAAPCTIFHLRPGMRPYTVAMKKILLVVGALALCGFESQWVPYTAKDGSFTVNLPGTPKVETNSQKVGAINVVSTMYSMGDDSSGFIAVQTTDIPPGAPSLTNEQRLNGARDGSVANVAGARLVSDKAITLGKWPGREYDVSVGANLMHCRIYMVKKRLYMMMALTTDGKPSMAEVRAFFNSFKLGEQK